jgi:hypothetical protein
MILKGLHKCGLPRTRDAKDEYVEILIFNHYKILHDGYY